MRPLTVATSRSKYPIYFIKNDWQGFARQIKKYFSENKIALVTSASVARHYAKPIAGALAREALAALMIRVPDGEKNKTLATINRLYATLLAAQMGRNDLLIALGGGVIGDMVGFAAATYLRGVPYIQVPTTLLAQVDSSVGGKTGVDHPKGKNLIGAFYQPQLVWIDTATLRTLPLRQIRAGFAEVIKYGAIADRRLFAELAKIPARTAQSRGFLQSNKARAIVRRCVEIKAEIVGRDEKETTGIRSLLNFGHTVGHAIEAASGYRGYLHGEAVAIGMVIAARVSEVLGLCPRQDVEQLIRCLENFGLETTLKKPLSLDRMMAYIGRDKKTDGQRVKFVALAPLGKARLHVLAFRDLAQLLKGIL